ncbi:MAG: hypothetical protein EA357_08400 [Micavibrio sp.]|nr:MAG: hypothetical protein EA357_08400 [Micavibrio sp.]
MSGPLERIKYHVMNGLESTVNSDGKIAVVVLGTALAGGMYFGGNAVENHRSALDDQGIAAVEQDKYALLSGKILTFQDGAQQLAEMKEQIDEYNGIRRRDRTPEINTAQTELEGQFAELRDFLNTKVKKITVTALASGNQEEGVAIGERQLRDLWAQLQHTEPSLMTLGNRPYNLEKFPEVSFNFLDEARANYHVNPDAPLDVRFNAAKDVASSSTGKSFGNGALAVLFTVLAAAAAGGAAAGINRNRIRQFGRYNKRPKPKKPGVH